MPRTAAALEPEGSEAPDLVEELLREEGLEDISLAIDDTTWTLRGLLRHGFAHTPSAQRSARADPEQRMRQAGWLKRLAQTAAASVRGHPDKAADGVAYDIPLSDHPLVDVYIKHFTGPGRWFFARWLARADRYIPIMQPLLEAKGLPKDTVYVAMVESGFVSHAYSHARASGFWQFIASTGRIYKLRQDSWVDERRDFIKATNAAATYLLGLYREFGDWHLAWAAYNAGAGRIHQAIRLTGASDYWSLVAEKRRLAKETRHYVPKIIAAAIIAKNREYYGFGHVEPLPPLQYDEVKVTAAIELKRVARRLGTSMPALRELNPALLYDITPPGRRYTLRVPKDRGPEVAQWLDGLPAKKRLTYEQHTVRSGDTLSEIAEHYGTTITAVADFNGIRNASRLRPGKRLIIPMLHGGKSKGGTRKVAARSRSRRQEPSATHRVAAGETLWSIARRHGVTVKQLKSWNGRLSNKIVVGEHLKVF